MEDSSEKFLNKLFYIFTTFKVMHNLKERETLNVRFIYELYPITSYTIVLLQ